MRILNEFRHIFGMLDCIDGAKKIKYAPKLQIKPRGTLVKKLPATEPGSNRAKTISMKYTLAALLALPFMAQPGSIAVAQDSGIDALMEEITVTARKREEGLQDTPIAVSVFSGESLEARGVQRIDEIAGLTPNMSFDNINTNGGGGNSAAVFLRGVGQRDFLPSADPGVGIYVDGVYYARSIGSVLDIIDIDRVEVLRGPQGTLFGRNTTGGAIAIHTQKPHEEFEGKVRVRVGIDDRLDVLGKVNVPMSDNVYMSATVAKFDQDGFVVNPLNGMDTGDDDTFAARGAIRMQVNNNLEINLSGDYSRDRENGQARVVTENPNRVIDPSPGANIFNHNFLLGANSPLNPANGGPGINNPGRLSPGVSAIAMPPPRTSREPPRVAPMPTPSPWARIPAPCRPTPTTISMVSRARLTGSSRTTWKSSRSPLTVTSTVSLPTMATARLSSCPGYVMRYTSRSSLPRKYSCWVRPPTTDCNGSSAASISPKTAIIITRWILPRSI